MITLHVKDITSQESRKLLSGSILPRPIALISTLQDNNKINVAPFSYFTIVSAEPPMISVSVRYDTDTQKDTSRNILRNKEFVVHIISPNYLEQANETSASLSREESELELAGLTAVESTSIKTPGILEAKVRFECEYVTHVPFEKNDLIIGRVKTFHIDEQIYDNGKILIEELNPVSRLSGARYGLIGDIISLETKK